MERLYRPWRYKGPEYAGLLGDAGDWPGAPGPGSLHLVEEIRGPHPVRVVEVVTAFTGRHGKVHHVVAELLTPLEGANTNVMVYNRAFWEAAAEPWTS